ncbi:hypothetical protein BV25DRAFT_1990069 [Artomyces pyxidatus]|uniref:Uncharacterized protein n=1 Tax=Artomyces pyxidatus TaxID=48021 RepID=A0ACB8T727_9AGAM|nr:hypothetical protein BV25DRAFT_1990069 [Artomyces pyxidatus]
MHTLLQTLLALLRKLRSSKGPVAQLLRRLLVLWDYIRRQLRIRVTNLWTHRSPSLREPEDVPPPPPSNSCRTVQRRPVVIAPSLLPTSASHPNIREQRTIRVEVPQRPRSTAYSVNDSIGPTSSVGEAHPLQPWHATLTTPGHGMYNFDNTSVASQASVRASIIHANSQASIRVEADARSVRSSRAPHSQFTSGPHTKRLDTSSRSRSASRRRGDAASVRPARSPMRGPPPPLPPPTAPYSAEHSAVSSNESFGLHVERPSTESLPRTRHSFISISIPDAAVGSPVSPDPVIGPTIPPSPTAEVPASRPVSVVESVATTSSTVNSVHDVHTERVADHRPEKPLPIPPEGRTVIPFHTDLLPRYVPKATAPRGTIEHWIDPRTTYFPHSPETHSYGWIKATHPDGAMYFYNPDTNPRTYTDVDMFDEALREDVEEFVKYLDDLAEATCQNYLPSNDCERVVWVEPGDQECEVNWFYYYVDHETRNLFWLERYCANDLIAEVEGVRSPAHIQLRLEAVYWTHWSMYPAGPESRHLKSEVYDQLLGILAHGCIDVMTSQTSTAPYNLEEMQLMTKIIERAQRTSQGSDYLMCSTARLMSFFAHWKFLYYHGQKEARLDQGVSVYGPVSRPRTFLITVISPMLFFAPEVHLKDLEKLWADEVIVQMTWKQFMVKLYTEWTEFILYATVILTVDVGFLAIPGVATDTNQNLRMSPAQVSSYLSIICSAGSIVMGLLLVRHHRTQEREKPGRAAEYMMTNTRPFFGLEPLAIIFSVPYALLMWAMLTFLIAILLLCFQDTVLATRIPVGVASCAVAWFVFWAILHAWDSGDLSGKTWLGSVGPALRNMPKQFAVKCKDVYTQGLHSALAGQWHNTWTASKEFWRHVRRR